MPTIADVTAAIKARMTSEWPHSSVPVYWENEDTVIADTPAPFVFVSVHTDRPFLSEFGGGRGANRWRQTGRVVFSVHVPRGAGRADADTYGEAAAVIFRGQRFAADIDFFEAGPIGPGGVSETNGQYWQLDVEAEFSFDQVG